MVARGFYNRVGDIPLVEYSPESTRGEHMEKDVLAIIAAVSKFWNVQIDFGKYKRTEKKALDSFIIRKPGSHRADIRVPADLKNVCWVRFLYTKELSHILLDTDEPASYTKDVENMIRALVMRMPPDQDGEAYHSEITGYYVATELLIPWSENDQLERLIAQGASTRKIAEYFRVPEIVAEMRTKHPVYRAVCIKTNQEIDATTTRPAPTTSTS